MNDHRLTERRRRALGPTYTHFYREPLYLVRGEGVWLFDNEGRRYLDCYNNVPSVGHCHPHVVAALTREIATLNTHTRYLHHNVVEYAERLAATLPGDLSVCLFVCTGSEANDLAYRIARAATGNDGAICTVGAYHGNTTLVAELSPEYERKRPRPDFIVDVEPPDSYRGRFAADDPASIDKYADLVDVAIDELGEQGHRPAMMIIDSIYDAAGVHTPSPEYQQRVHGKVRAAGGLVVCDEVQSGLTRLGDNYWGFMDSGVVPDIVTMGKGLGAGLPVAAWSNGEVATLADAREQTQDRRVVDRAALLGGHEAATPPADGIGVRVAGGVDDRAAGGHEQQLEIGLGGLVEQLADRLGITVHLGIDVDAEELRVGRVDRAWLPARQGLRHAGGCLALGQVALGGRPTEVLDDRVGEAGGGGGGLHVARLAGHVEGHGLALLEGHEDGVLDLLGGLDLAEVLEHQHRAEHQRGGVDDVLARVLGG